jgi:hypothetical protein
MSEVIKHKKKNIRGFPKPALPISSLVRRFHIVNRSVEESKVTIRYTPQQESELPRREVIEENFTKVDIKDAYGMTVNNVVIRTSEYIGAKVLQIVHLNESLKIKANDSDLANPNEELFFAIRLFKEDGSSEIIVTDNKVFYNCNYTTSMIELRDQGINRRYLRERTLITAAIENYMVSMREEGGNKGG